MIRIVFCAIFYYSTIFKISSNINDSVFFQINKCMSIIFGKRHHHWCSNFFIAFKFWHMFIKMFLLTLIWTGVFAVGGGGGGEEGEAGEGVEVKLIPSSKSYKIEIWYLRTHTYVISEKIAFSTKTFLILLIWASFCIFDKNSTFTQSTSTKTVLEMFLFCLQYL